MAQIDQNGHKAIVNPITGTTQIVVPTSAPKESDKSTSSTARKLNFLGWGVLLLGLYALNGTSLGHEAIYYSLVLIILFLFANNYQRILGVITTPQN